MGKGKYIRTKEHREILKLNRLGKKQSENAKRNLREMTRSEHTCLHRFQKSINEMNSDKEFYKRGLFKSNITVTKKVVFVGKSLGLVIDKPIIEKMKLKRGDLVEVEFKKVE